MRQGQSSRRMCSGTTPPSVHFKWPRSGPASWSYFDTVLHELRDEISNYLLARPESETAAAPDAAVGSASAPLPCLGGRHR